MWSDEWGTTKARQHFWRGSQRGSHTFIPRTVLHPLLQLLSLCMAVAQPFGDGFVDDPEGLVGV